MKALVPYQKGSTKSTGQIKFLSYIRVWIIKNLIILIYTLIIRNNFDTNDNIL